MRQFYNFPGFEPQAFDETDVYQIPFLINREAILGEVDLLLSVFVSNKDVNSVSAKLRDLLFLLEIMMQRRPDAAKRIRREIIEMLLHAETDDDTFPIFQLQEAYAIIGEEKTYDEVGELYCESIG